MITVVGGSYHEIIDDPETDQLRGSGLRAAVMLGERVDRFVTVAEAAIIDAIQLVTPGVELEITERTAGIGFRYLTPVSRAEQFGDDSHELVIEQVGAENVLQLGLVEAAISVTAKRLVLDPQHSIRRAELSQTLSAERNALVANSKEIRRLGGSENLREATQNLLRRTRADVVVVKCGALGALALSKDREFSFSARETGLVHPVGSGDAFSAGFAHAWLNDLDIAEAGERGASFAAAYCSTNQMSPFDTSGLPLLPPPSFDSVAEPPTVYLASSYDTLANRWITRTAVRALEDVGVKVFCPLREVGPKTTASETAMLDIAGLKDCSSVLVLMDNSGSGPSFEAALAFASGTSVVVHSSNRDPDKFTMLRGTGAAVHHDFASAVYHAAWKAILAEGR